MFVDRFFSRFALAHSFIWYFSTIYVATTSLSSNICLFCPAFKRFVGLCLLCLYYASLCWHWNRYFFVVATSLQFTKNGNNLSLSYWVKIYCRLSNSCLIAPIEYNFATRHEWWDLGDLTMMRGTKEINLNMQLYYNKKIKYVERQVLNVASAIHSFFTILKLLFFYTLHYVLSLRT